MEEISFIHASVVLIDRIIKDGAVVVRNGVISWIGPSTNLPTSNGKIMDLGGYYLSPGFIDLQVHGAVAVEATYAKRTDLVKICRFHEQFGTTSICLTVLPSPDHQMKTALANIASVAQVGSEGARMLGANMQGPFLNPHWVDLSQGRWLLEPSIEDLKKLFIAAQGWVRIVTFAPELEGMEAVVRWLTKDMGLVASIGNTGATCAQTQKAMEWGATMATHLFNAMKPFHHREPSTSGAILASDCIAAQIVMDGLRVHPIAAKIAFNALGPDRFCLVSDATSVLGTNNGVGKHSGREIALHNGVAKFKDEQVAGSALTMIDAVKNTIDMLGVDYQTAIRCASHTPAKILGLDDRIGSISVGNHADLLVLDKSDLRVLVSFVGGKRIFRSNF